MWFGTNDKNDLKRRTVIRYVIIISLACFSATLAASFASAAETLRATVENRPDWAAIGLVRLEGTEDVVVCSGTLVAPDLVVTSAHCTTKYEGLLFRAEFVAGLNGTRFVATSGAVEVKHHPKWASAAGPSKTRYDIATLRLARPIPRDKIAPISLFPPAVSLPDEAALVGYRSEEVKTIRGTFNCALNRGLFVGLLSSPCDAEPGNSGGAVLVEWNEKWKLAAVIVAHQSINKSAVMAELDPWVSDQVIQALERETRLARAD